MWLIGRLEDAAQIPGKKRLLPPLWQGGHVPRAPHLSPSSLGSGVPAEDWATGSPLGLSMPKESWLRPATAFNTCGFLQITRTTSSLGFLY